MSGLFPFKFFLMKDHLNILGAFWERKSWGIEKGLGGKRKKGKTKKAWKEAKASSAMSNAHLTSNLIENTILYIFNINPLLIFAAHFRVIFEKTV